MSSPHPVHTPDFDDEPRDIHVDPMSLRHEAEEEPLELESSEEEEPEEEPEEEQEEEQEEEPEEEEEEEEEPEEEPEEEETRPNTRPREPSFRPYLLTPSGPVMMYTPRKRVRIPEPFPVFVNDPYLPSSSSSHQLPETPTPHTVSQLSDRIDQHEVEIELLQDNVELLPGSEQFDEVHREVETVRDDYRTLRDFHERLEGRVAGNTSRLDEMELQVRRFGEELTDLRSMMEELTDVRSMMEEMRDSISHLARRLPRPRREE